MKCANKPNCKNKFSEIKFYHGIKYFCSSSCRQEYIKNLGNNQFDRTVKIKPIKQISSKNSNTPAKFTSKTKGEMLKRDGGCIICGSRNNIEYHHIFYGGQAEYGEDRNDLNKGVCLCHSHHHEIHHGNGMIGQALRERCKDYIKKV